MSSLSSGSGPIRRLVGLRVERTLFLLPPGTSQVGDPVCVVDPDDCCPEGAGSGDVGSGMGSGGAALTVPAFCEALSGYYFPSRIHMTIDDYFHSGCTPGGGIGCPELFGSSIPLDWDGIDSWRANPYTLGNCSIYLRLEQGFSASSLNCFHLFGFWQSNVWPFYSELIDTTGDLFNAAEVVPDPFYVRFESPNDTGGCAGIYHFTE